MEIRVIFPRLDRQRAKTVDSGRGHTVTAAKNREPAKRTGDFQGAERAHNKGI